LPFDSASAAIAEAACPKTPVRKAVPADKLMPEKPARNKSRRLYLLKENLSFMGKSSNSTDTPAGS
jgi:hypothetical protein